MSRITDYILEPKVVYTEGGFLVRVKVIDDYKYKKYIVSENLHYKTVQGTSFTLTDADTTKQASITEIKGAGEKRKLPVEYQEVEYIQTTRTQWINTLYSMLEQNVWKLETKVNLTGNSLAIMGYALVTDTSNEVWTDGQGYIIARFLPEVNRVVIKQLSLNTDYTITFDNNSNNFIVSINEETFTYNRIEPRQRTNAPIGFGHRQGGAYLKGKIYSLKMWSDTLERNFIPCYRVIDNVVGMYDTVTNTFYENAGTDAFGKGADILYNNVTGDNEIVVNNKNWFNYQYSQLRNINRVTITEETNGFKLTSTGVAGYGFASLPIDNSLLGKQVTISCNSTGNKTPSARLFYHNSSGRLTSNIGAFWTTNTAHTVTLPSTLPSNESGIDIVFYISQGNNASGDNAIFTDIQIEKGTQATSYIAHQSNSYRVDLGGKNLLNNTLLTNETTKNGITATPNADGSITLNGTASGNAFFNLCRIDFGTTSFNSVSGGSSQYVASTSNSLNTVRLVYDASNKYTFLVVYSGNTVTDFVIYPQIEEGSQATPYSPYTANPIELSENDKLWNNNGTWQLNDTEITDTYLLNQLNALKNIQLYEDLCYVDWIGSIEPTMTLQYAGTEDLGIKYIITEDGKKIRTDWRKLGRRKNGR